MNIGWHIVEQERQEAVERAMSRFRAHQARDMRRGKTHPRSAWKLLQEHFGGRTNRGN
jgi:hypothetical protein